jgi:ABC-type nitrate/sulfonate/bicarbonate transport system permease component
MSFWNPRLIDVRPPSRRRYLLLGALGIVILLVAFELIATSRVFGRALLPIEDIAAAWTAQGNLTTIGRNVGVTLMATLWGYLAGAAAGILLAICAFGVPWTRRFLERVSILTWVLPTVALAPALMTAMDPSSVPAVISAWFVFYYVFVALLEGLDSSDGAHADYFSSVGASARATFLHLRTPSALPMLADGLRLAAPAAVMGAVFGEWFGATKGIGVLLVTSLQNLRIDLMWVSATLVIVLAGLASLLLTIVQRLIRKRFAE